MPLGVSTPAARAPLACRLLRHNRPSPDPHDEMDAALLALVLVDIQSASASAIFFCFCLSFRLIVFLPLCVSPCAQATIAQTSRGSRAEQDTRQSEANDVLLFQAPAIKGKKKQTETRESRTREEKKKISVSQRQVQRANRSYRSYPPSSGFLSPVPPLPLPPCFD